jgi:predicted porin
MYVKSAMAAFCVAMVAAGAANALTLTNRDSESMDVTVATSEGSSTMTLESGASGEAMCEGGCTVSLPDGTSEELEGDESIAIENGAFVRVE